MNVETRLGDITQSLETLLESEQEPAGWFRVSLECPTELQVNKSNKPLINLFLLHLRPNPMGREAAVPVNRDSVKGTRLSLHLTYVLTPFAQNPLDAQRALATAMAVFDEHATLPPARLHGALAHGDQALHLDLCPHSLEEQTNLWSSLGAPYRTSVCYRVRPVGFDNGQTEPVTRVRTIDLNTSPRRERRPR